MTFRFHWSHVDHKGQLCRRILTRYQGRGSTPDFLSFLLRHGCRTDNIRNDLRVRRASQTAHVAWPAGPVCDEVNDYVSPVEFGQWGQYGQIKDTFYYSLF